MTSSEPMDSSEQPLSVTFLGTCGGLPEAGRDSPCFLVNRRILVDTGWYAADRLLAHGMDPLDIDAVLITHSHADHYLALPQIFLYHACNKAKRNGRPPLRVVGPAPDIEALVEETRHFIRLARDPALELPVDVVPALPGQTLEVRDLRVRTCEARHGVPALAYRVEHDSGASVTFSGDTGPHTPIAELAKGTDLLVHDAVIGSKAMPQWAERHCTAVEAAEIARHAGARELAIVHMPPRDADNALASAKEVFPGTFLPQEGERVQIPR